MSIDKCEHVQGVFGPYCGKCSMDMVQTEELGEPQTCPYCNGHGLIRNRLWKWADEVKASKRRAPK